MRRGGKEEEPKREAPEGQGRGRRDEKNGEDLRTRKERSDYEAREGEDRV